MQTILFTSAGKLIISLYINIYIVLNYESELPGMWQGEDYDNVIIKVPIEWNAPEWLKAEC